MAGTTVTRAQLSEAVYEEVGLSRNEMIFDKQKLLEVYDQTIDQKPM